MKTYCFFVVVGLILSVRVNAAVHADATLDWSGFSIISSNENAAASFEKNITPIMDGYYSGHQFLIIDKATGCYDAGFGCELLTPNTSNLFNETESLGSGNNMALAILNDDVTYSVANRSSEGFAMSAPAGFATLATTGAGTFTLRLPYSINIWSDEGSLDRYGEAVSMVRLAYLVPGSVNYQVVTYSFENLVELAGQTGAQSKRGVLEVSINASDAFAKYEFSYDATSFVNIYSPQVAPVPEPENYAILCAGLLMCFAQRTRVLQKKRRALA